jgi:hypothetical protein
MRGTREKGLGGDRSIQPLPLVIATMRAKLRPSFVADLRTAIKDFQDEEDCGQPPDVPEDYWTNSVSPEYDFFWSAKGCSKMTESYQEVCDMSSQQRTTFDNALLESAKTFTEVGTEGTKMVSTADTSRSGRPEGERARRREESTTRKTEGSQQTEDAISRGLRREIERLRSRRQKRKEKSRRRRQSKYQDTQDDSTSIAGQERTQKNRRITINLPRLCSSITLNLDGRPCRHCM